jgi:hypothetical protein
LYDFNQKIGPLRKFIQKAISQVKHFLDFEKTIFLWELAAPDMLWISIPYFWQVYPPPDSPVGEMGDFRATLDEDDKSNGV